MNMKDYEAVIARKMEIFDKLDEVEIYLGKSYYVCITPELDKVAFILRGDLDSDKDLSAAAYLMLTTEEVMSEEDTELLALRIKVSLQ